MNEYCSDSAVQTMRIASDFARQLHQGDIVFLEGELGAGKTTFVKGLLLGLGGNPDTVNSPTFIIMNEYQATMPVYHFDCYRLQKPGEISSVNFDDYFFGEGISVIEWPQRLEAFSPKPHWVIQLTHVNEHTRRIKIEKR